MKQSIQDELRNRVLAIASRGRTVRSIAADCGVDESVLSRWLRDERDILLTTAGKISETVGMRLVKSRK